jgi:hypothetical protein
MEAFALTMRLVALQVGEHREHSPVIALTPPGPVCRRCWRRFDRADGSTRDSRAGVRPAFAMSPAPAAARGQLVEPLPAANSWATTRIEGRAATYSRRTAFDELGDVEDRP